MKQLMVTFLMLTSIVPLDIVAKAGDQPVHRDMERNEQRKKMITALVASTIVLGGLSVSVYLWQRNHASSKGTNNQGSRGLPITSKPLLYQSFDRSKYTITASNTINEQATENLRRGYATNDWTLIKQSIAEGGLNSVTADKLFDDIKTPNGIYYFAANYPRNIKTLLEKQDLQGNTRLQNEIKKNLFPAVIEALINVGSDVHVLELPTKRTPLMLAADRDDAKTFVILVAHDADLNTQDWQGQDVWHYIKEDSSLIKQIKDYQLHYPQAVAQILSWVHTKA